MAKVSKVVKNNGDVIMDISKDNVNANNLLQGGTAHGSDGEAVQGAVIVAPTDVTEVSDTTPYIYKASEHDAVYDELVGGSVAWNQLVANSGSSLSVTITSGHKYAMKKSGTLSVSASNGSAITGLTGGTDWITDLTLMFGSTIADYVYNLEQSTAGSGIAWLKSYGFFTKDYYAYNAGGLVSVNTSGKKVVSETAEITYPIQSTDLRGLYKLNGTKLYTDGDIYSADGIVTRKYGIVDLGTLNWTYALNNYFHALVPSIKQPINSVTFNAINSKYIVKTWDSWYRNKINGTCGFGNDGRMYVSDSSYTDATTFKTAMSGVYLIYELATPTTETAQPFTTPQMVYRNGTEEYLDTRDVPMPVGGNRKYVDIPEWMVNEYFDDVRAQISTLKTISKLQKENEVLRNALSQSTYFIPEGTTIIDSNTVTDKTKCFYYMPDTVHTIDENAFKGCANLINITLPDNVVTIEEAAFSNCKSLANINLSDTTLWIYDVAFFNCKSLTSIAIPSSVISISSSAFRGCTNLTSIVINKPQDSISGAPWEATNATVTWTG